LTFTVQPREIRAFLAVMPAPVGAALVPTEKTLLSSSIPFDVPFDSIDIRILLTEVAVRAQSWKAILKFVQGQPLNTPAGKSAKAVHSPHAPTADVSDGKVTAGKEVRAELFQAPFVLSRLTQLVPIVVAAEKFNAGNDVNPHVCQVEIKVVPLLVSINGKELRLLQLYQVKLKLVPLLVTINGNELRLVQFCQVELKLVLLLVSINGNELRLVQFFQARCIRVTLLVLMSGKLVSPVQFSHTPKLSLLRQLRFSCWPVPSTVT